MDRRTILAVVLSVGIYYTWLALRGVPEVEEPAPEPVPVEAPAPAPEVAPSQTDAPVRELELSSCDFEALLTTEGGGLTEATLPDHEGPLDITPIYTYVVGLVTGDSEGAWHPYGDTVHPEVLLSGEARALVAGSGNPAESHRRYEVVSQSESELTLRSVGGDGVEVIQSFRPAEGEGACTFDVSVTWTNRGTEALEPTELWFGMFDRFAPPGGMFAAYQNRLNAFARVDGDLEYGEWTEPEEGARFEPQPLENESAAWIALADRYFGVFAMPVDKGGSVSWAWYGPDVGEEALRGMTWSPTQGLKPGESHEASFQVYIGPHDTDVLAAVDETLVEIVDFGMFAVFCWPLLFALQWLHGLLGNWGLAIIALTVAVKAVFFPLTQSAFKSGEKMKAIQPLMNEIRETYKDQPEELNRRTMELFKEHRVNPLGGCLPMFIQMPVFLSLFYVLMYSSDLYHTDFLYLQDLSSPDPTCVLPAIVVVLMLIQQQFTPMGNMDPAQARMMKMMPLMFGVFWFFFPSGLVVYYFINTVLSVLQQWWIRRTISTTAAPVPGA